MEFKERKEEEFVPVAFSISNDVAKTTSRRIEKTLLPRTGSNLDENRLINALDELSKRNFNEAANLVSRIKNPVIKNDIGPKVVTGMLKFNLFEPAINLLKVLSPGEKRDEVVKELIDKAILIGKLGACNPALELISNQKLRGALSKKYSASIDVFMEKELAAMRIPTILYGINFVKKADKREEYAIKTIEILRVRRSLIGNAMEICLTHVRDKEKRAKMAKSICEGAFAELKASTTANDLEIAKTNSLYLAQFILQSFIKEGKKFNFSEQDKTDIHSTLESTIISSILNGGIIPTMVVIKKLGLFNSKEGWEKVYDAMVAYAKQRATAGDFAKVVLVLSQIYDQKVKDYINVAVSEKIIELNKVDDFYGAKEALFVIKDSSFYAAAAKRVDKNLSAKINELIKQKDLQGASKLLDFVNDPVLFEKCRIDLNALENGQSLRK